MVRKRSGFTLVELLVVIGIIAVLMSLLIPALSKARKSAVDVKCRSNLRQIGNATRLYANDNFDHYPDGYTLGGGFTRVGPGMKSPGDPYAVPEVFGLPTLYRDLGYLKANEVWICAGARQEIQDWGNTYIWALLGGQSLTSVTRAIPSNVARWTSLQRGRTEDKNTRSAEGGSGSLGIYFVYDNYTNYPWTSGSRTTSSSGNVTFPTHQQVLPHNYIVKKTDAGVRQGSINVLFIDGHVGVVLYFNKGGVSKTEKLRDP